MKGCLGVVQWQIYQVPYLTNRAIEADGLEIVVIWIDDSEDVFADDGVMKLSTSRGRLVVLDDVIVAQSNGLYQQNDPILVIELTIHGAVARQALRTSVDVKDVLPILSAGHQLLAEPTEFDAVSNHEKVR